VSHFSRIFSLVAIINTSSKQLCNQRLPAWWHSTPQSDSLIMPPNNWHRGSPRHTWLGHNFQGQRSKVKVTRPLYSARP